MAFLLSNDDGVHAPGLNCLAEHIQRAGYDFSLVAPDRDHSGASNSLTLDRPLHPTLLESGYVSINGTPTDCVHLGLNLPTLFPEGSVKPERVISGINSGANLGDDVLYSGTVAAAMEGRFLNKAPIAISLVGRHHFETAAQVILELLPRIKSLNLPQRCVININVPDVPYDQLSGMQVTRLGHRARSDNPVHTVNPRGKECYWISAAGDGDDAGEGTDFHAIEHNFVSITPIKVDMTMAEAMAQLESGIHS